MSISSNFRQKAQHFGTWLSIGSPVIAELASQFSFDWLLLDMEHGNIGADDLLNNLRALHNEQTATIVRLPGIDEAAIAQALDWGVHGLMMPHIGSAEQAQACVEAMYYPPFGKRGFSSSVRKYGYGKNVPSDIHQDKPLLFTQIENLQGVLNIDDIAAVAGVDVLFVGPADLKLALSQQTEIGFDDALIRVANAAQNHGKKAGILLRNRADFPQLKELGFTCWAVDSDIALLRNGYTQLVEWFGTAG